EKEGDWLAVSAEQWFTTETPGFIWRADVGAGSLLQFSGRDQFIDAKGKMLIKAYGMIEVVNADGPKIDQGAAVRFLSEIIWFPAAATADYISWEQTDSLSATATFSYLGQTVSGIFKFNESGQLISFLAARFYDKSGKLENWLITIDPQSETEFESVLVPTQASVTWQLAEGDFTWYDLEIIDLKYTP
ncbi:MAG: hypothetical protein KDD94_15495, partial [Calditrichaeota bacterium]|nr:hypothetical protein [Calditrichota bacterium]